MNNIITQITMNILLAFYQPLLFGLLVAFLFMFFIFYVREHGWSQAIKVWIDSFRKQAEFRRIFFLALYGALVLFRTLLNRQLWLDPLSNIYGGWTLHTSDGSLTTEAMENFIMFLPFTYTLVSIILHGKKEKLSFGKIVLFSLKYTFFASFLIESLQIILHVGTFQFSDLFYNTTGGILGGILCYVIYCLKMKQ